MLFIKEFAETFVQSRPIIMTCLAKQGAIPDYVTPPVSALPPTLPPDVPPGHETCTTIADGSVSLGDSAIAVDGGPTGVSFVTYSAPLHSIDFWFCAAPINTHPIET